jgi:hypothetical protein
MSTYPDDAPAGDEIPGLLPPFRPAARSGPEVPAAPAALPPFMPGRTRPQPDAAAPASARTGSGPQAPHDAAEETTEPPLPWEASAGSDVAPIEPAADAMADPLAEAGPNEPEVPAWLDWLDTEADAEPALHGIGASTAEEQILDLEAGYLAFEEPLAADTAGPDETAFAEAWTPSVETVAEAAPARADEGAAVSAAEATVDALSEVADRLDAIARTLRSVPAFELLGRADADPLELLIAGYALGYAQGRARGGTAADPARESDPSHAG